MAFENFFSKVTEVAQTGMAKGKELTEIGKLKVENVAEQESIKKAYQEIGKIYFETCGSNPESIYATLCAKIRDSKEKIAYNLERIEDIKSTGGVREEKDLFEEPLNGDEPEQ